MTDRDGFVHRPHDGLYDSICRRCFRTIAVAAVESDLAEYEERHVCSAESVANLKTGQSKLASC